MTKRNGHLYISIALRCEGADDRSTHRSTVHLHGVGFLGGATVPLFPCTRLTGCRLANLEDTTHTYTFTHPQTRRDRYRHGP